MSDHLVSLFYTTLQPDLAARRAGATTKRALTPC
jgi:hypothetical protein